MIKEIPEYEEICICKGTAKPIRWEEDILILKCADCGDTFDAVEDIFCSCGELKQCAESRACQSCMTDEDYDTIKDEKATKNLGDE